MNENSKILRVDLTKEIFSEENSKELQRRFIGGRGTGAWMLFKEMKPETRPLDPDNLLIISAGPLCGTDFPGSARLNLESKNCMTNGVNWSNMGGFLGSELRHAGWSDIVIIGRAERPVYLVIRDSHVELRNAAHLWGADVWETESIIRYELDDSNVQVAAIGIAGENLVPMAVVITNRTRAAASGGLGAIMGSKNLKAIAVRGTGSTPIADYSRFKSISDRIRSKLSSAMDAKNLGNFGTFFNFITPVNDVCAYPFRNTQDDHYVDIENSRIGASKWKRTDGYFNSCYECPINCGKSYLEADEGPYKGLRINVPEHNTHYAFGSRLDMQKASNILKAWEQISRYGLDNDAIAVAMSWAFECYERGILNDRDTDGLDLSWGNDSSVIALIRKIAEREGFGALIGKGCSEASKVIGKGSEYYCTSLKGQDNLDCLRACKGWALGNIVSLRGGRHLDGATATELAPHFTPDVSKKLFGIATAYIPNSYESKGRLVSWFSHFKAAIDSIGVCYFTSWWSSPSFCGPEEYAEALSAASGQDMDGEEFLLLGRRISNIEKAFNTLHAGFMRKDDYPPLICMKEPIRTGKYRGEFLSEEKYNDMLSEFYETNGWDKETGWQFEETLNKLELPEVAKKLKSASRIP